MRGWTRSLGQRLQGLGRALMLPIAVLPVAALLLRLGQPDLLGLEFVSAAGNAMFANLGLLFAIGVATGFARDGNGAAPLAGAVCFLVASEGARALLAIPPEVTAGVAANLQAAVTAAWSQSQIARLSVPIGIVSGIVGGSAYNRFHNFRAPEYLAFFGGRRFVPIVSGTVGVVIAGIVGAAFPAVNSGIDGISRLALASGEWGLFVYGLLNRLLLVTGLHHIINNVAWFVLGDYHGTTGDLRRFFAGDPDAGAFMTGFFPVMMFGLPAACLAMYRSALPERRKATGGMLLSLAATSFLTGVTEPIEFSFMFLAPVLFVVHAVLTGVSMALMSALDVHLGFGFSAGLFDYVLNFGKAQKPLLLLPVGLAYFAVYYGVFRWVILRFDLKTPGREAVAGMAERRERPAGERGLAFLDALGGTENLREIGACTTRLRLVVAEQGLIDEAELRALGAKGIIRPSAHGLQVVLGPIADAVADEIRAAAHGGARTPVAAVPSPKVEADGTEAFDPARLPADVRKAIGPDAAIWATHGRLLVDASAKPDLEALAGHGLRRGALVGTRWHLLFEPVAVERWRSPS
ncbi:N-acetylglucosamine-specific PTS transporter subunit IIBC [Novosphingobium sp. HR1a]|nr:N-acetylglucosamine-specific PTS transporter subunit IIBC [Novosphingobium sp. HR1a]MBF7014956.1 PTS transporter subunit EIIC [Novosphingobium sp. HR1a]